MPQIFILFIIVFLIGCSNKTLFYNYEQSSNYNKIYNTKLYYAKKGFPKYSYDVSKMIYLNQVKKPVSVQRNYALYAYKNGIKKAGVIVADSYYKEKNYKKALEWYLKSDFNTFRKSDFQNLLQTLINNNEVNKTEYLQQIEKKANKQKNILLYSVLGDFYINNKKYANNKKGEFYLSQAYKNGDMYSGVDLGIFYINNNQKEKGLKILTKLAKNSAKASFFLAKYFYNEMIKQEKLMNKNCITLDFNTSSDFYKQKIKVYKYNRLYTIKNIIPLYKHAYNLGYKKAMYNIIRLDLEDNTYELEKNTYSGYDLNTTIHYLQTQQDLASKLLLASIYTKYPYLNRLYEAKRIYKWYSQYDKIDATWKLYRFEKQYENIVNYKYLDFLVKNNFYPAIIEKAYQYILREKNITKNMDILKCYAKKDNLLAINYLASIYSTKVLNIYDKRKIYLKKACILSSKPFYIPNVDLKIANDHINDDKYFIINYYYAMLKNRQAEYNLAKIFKQSCQYAKLKKYLNFLKQEKFGPGLLYYYQLILNGTIDGDYKEAVKYLAAEDNAKSYDLLGDFYSKGYFRKIDIVKAEKYYMKSFNKGNKQAILKIISMYQRLNVNNIFDNKIMKLFNIAIKNNVSNSKYLFVKYLISKNKKQEALKVLKTIPNYKTDAKCRYLYYSITKKTYYLDKINTNYGYMLYAKASRIKDISPQLALYYVFRAMLCNTPNAEKLSYMLIKTINNPYVIQKIYNKAKKAPKCSIN